MSDTFRRCFVTGRVQGVFFRASARKEGRLLGLRVKARNLRDGRVEVVAAGDEAALDALCRWLHEGPSMAQVTRVSCQAADEQSFASFAEC
jgi:acylphosphatase